MSTPPKLGQYLYPQHDDRFDSPALSWLRNHSDYLRGGGFLGTLGATVIYLRGFVANLLIVFPLLLLIGMLLGTFHHWILENSFVIAGIPVCCAVIFFVAFFSKSTAERLRGSSSGAYQWLAWIEANASKCIVLLAIASFVVLASPQIIQLFWRMPAIDGFSVTQCVGVVVPNL